MAALLNDRVLKATELVTINLLSTKNNCYLLSFSDKNSWERTYVTRTEKSKVDSWWLYDLQKKNR